MTKVLLTGANGFLGAIILNYLNLNEKLVDTLGQDSRNSIKIDLSCEIPQLRSQYHQIIHCAGKAHSIPKSVNESERFDKVNFQGTINLCKSIEILGYFPVQFVFISTVAVYGKDEGENINEIEHLNGLSPYAKSKIEAENYLINWGKKNNVKILILRLPLIVGSNPPGNLGRMIKGIRNGTYLSIGGGLARKSMVLASDVAQLIVANPEAHGIYNLTDGYNPTFYEIEGIIANALNKRRVFKIPLLMANFLAKIGDFVPYFPLKSEMVRKITTNLTFSDVKARKELNWKPKSVVKHWKLI